MSESSLFSLFVVISCGDPGPIGNGIYIGNEFIFNKTVHYRCNPGYVMEPPGSSTLRCSKDGTWNRTKPSCRGKFIIQTYRKYSYPRFFLYSQRGQHFLSPCKQHHFKRYTNIVEFLASQHQKPFRCF